jgi:hypothetical protein
MINLSLKDSETFLGTISDSDFQLLIDQLEEEHEGDSDYYFNQTMVEVLKERGASTNLVQLLTDAIGGSEGIEVAWKKV